jgi:hypothetical protein
MCIALVIFKKPTIPPFLTVNVSQAKFPSSLTLKYIIQKDQHVVVEITQAILNKTEAPCGFDLRAGGEIYLPAETHLHGANSTFAGLITGNPHGASVLFNIACVISTTTC